MHRLLKVQTVVKTFPNMSLRGSCRQLHRNVTGFQNPQFKFTRKEPPKVLPKTTSQKSKTTLFYLMALGVATVGASYAAVPLYRIFCQSTSYGGTVKEGHDVDKVTTMEAKKERLIKVLQHN